MSRPIATIDTSVLVSLQCAELLGVVSVLFDRLLVPARVREELKHGGEQNKVALRAIDDFAIFERCDDFDPTAVKLLLDTREHLKKGRDQGEAEAIVQAAQRSATMILVEDPLGRKWARRHAIPCHGTLWVCHELRYRGYIADLRTYCVRLIRGGAAAATARNQ